MVSPADMVLFAVVVREGSFTSAARQLRITKQTASERIAKLEEQLGVRLLERTTRRLRVTDAGAAYFDRCSAIATQIEEANREVQQLQIEPTGVLRVSAPVLYGRRYLAPVLASYLERYPKLRVELLLADRRVNLVEEGLDLAIRIGVLEDSSLSARKLGDGYVYYAASPDYLAARGSPTPNTLDRARFVGTKTVEKWPLFGAPIRIAPVLVVNDLEIACDAAIAGVGVARLPGLVCRQAVEQGRLRVLFGPEPAIRSPVYAVFPSRRHLAPKIRVFLEELARLIEPMLPLDVSNVGRQRQRPRVTSTNDTVLRNP